ncbi:MAG: ribonuclease HI family protein [Candidatus Omnitrophica bacterium]|nr:ribonuclease HI family protein [Candidatus Omnitrophota bacterium]
MSPPSSLRRRLVIHIDGAAKVNPGPAGIGVVLSEESGRPISQIDSFLGDATNNVAESMALIVALQESLKLSRRKVKVLTDSELLSRQVTGVYRVKDQTLRWLHVLIRQLVKGFEEFEITHIPRSENRLADRLANQAVSEGLKKRERGQKTFW